MNFFTKIEGKENDPAKPTIAFLVYDNNLKYDYIFGFTKVIMQILSKTHNIITLGKDEPGDYLNYGSFYKFNSKRHSIMKDEVFLRCSDIDDEDDPNWKQNRILLLKEYESCFKNELKGIEKIIICHDIPFQLSFTGYISQKVNPHFHNRYNDYFDYVGNDENIIQKIVETNKKVVDEFDRKTSIIAFTTYFKNVYNTLLDFIVDQNKDIFKMVYGFIIDPTFFTPYFVEKNIPFTSYYFANDKRGTRNFKYFPIGQLQHLVYDDLKEEKKSISLFDDKNTIEKSKNFFFAGTVMQEKGNRTETWKTFIKDLNVKNSDIYVPLKANGIYYSEKEKTKNINTALKKFPGLYDEIKSHPMYAGHLSPDEYNNKIKKYKYGLLLRCVSISDSLNFRPILYAKYDILPLIDYMYDPEYLQIPEDIQKHLVIRNHTDIEEKIEFFNKNEELRKSLLLRLRIIFEIDTFKNNYFNTIESFFNERT